MIVILLPGDELSNTHPKIVNVPPLEDVPKVLAKEHPLEGVMVIDDINPLAPVAIGHDLKGLPERLRLVNLEALSAENGEEGADVNVVVGCQGGLIGDAEKVEEDILEGEDGDEHSGVRIFDKDAVDLLSDHVHYDDGDLGFLHH